MIVALIKLTFNGNDSIWDLVTVPQGIPFYRTLTKIHQLLVFCLSGFTVKS